MGIPENDGIDRPPDGPVSAGARSSPRTAERLGRWIAARASSVGTAVRTHPLRAVERVVAFVLRWALRVALPIGGAAMMLHVFPYHATAGGMHFRVEGTILKHPGLSADTTFGSWEFPNVDGLPIGAHVSPENVDVVRLASAATARGSTYADELRADFEDQVPRIIGWLATETLIGVALGLLLAAAINLALRYLRHEPWRDSELRHRARQLSAVCAVLALTAGYGAISYNPRWVKDSRVTGTLGALQLFPDQLSRYYTQQSKALDVINAIAGIQAQLQQRIEQQESPSTSFNVMFISDMHLASTYPLVAQYAANFDVKLIVNTGDESEFGTRFELTPAYVSQVRAVTESVPMIWLAGNHDSPETIRVMSSIPGVVVVGTKSAHPDGSYTVGAQALEAFGLTIAALPDPRVYGGGGANGSNDQEVVGPLERKAVEDAVRSVPEQARFDIFATHAPAAAEHANKVLPGQIRQTNSGHRHEQNDGGEIQKNGRITLVEGSTGAGGLDNINRGVPPPPVEFTIESVATDCQFTRLLRFQLAGPLPEAADVLPVAGQQVTATTTYLNPQEIDEGRFCSTGLGIGAPRDIAVAG